jgi:hypothetical protein
MGVRRLNRLLPVFMVLGVSGVFGQAPTKTGDGKNFMPLPGRVTGILRTDAGRDLQRDGRTVPADVVGFVTGEEKERIVYCPCHAGADNCQSLKVLVGKEGKQRKDYPSVELLTSRNLHFYLPQEGLYRLVEVDVNDGLGSPNTDFFIASNVVVLDGTDYFVRLDPIVKKIKTEFKKNVQAQAGKMDNWLEKSHTEAIGAKAASGPREAETRVFVTWIAEKKQVMVELRHLITDGDYGYASGVGKKGSQVGSFRVGTQFGVEVLARFAIDRQGGISETPVEWRTFKHKLPIPH